MRRTILLLFIACAALHSNAQDQCSTALPIGLGTYTADAVNGPEVALPICTVTGPGATHSEWYTYTATEDTAITVSTDLPTNAGLDTRFHIYMGTCGALTCAGGDDDGGTGLSSVTTINVTSGVTYTIAFDDRWDASGYDFEISLAEAAPADAFIMQYMNTAGLSDCVVDMNGDGLDDVVSVTSTNIRVNFQQAVGGFVDADFPTTPANNVPSWSICAGDLNDNGYNDLVYGGSSGITMMISNSDGTAYTELSEPEYIFCQRTNMVDINNDGWLDVFSCHDVEPNVYYLNDGQGAFVWNQGGLGDTPDGGNYGSIWVDYDNDHDVDMFIAKCRGGNSVAAIDQLHRNNGDGTFTEVGASMGLAELVGQTPYHQSWSAAWGDFDNDGDMDVLIGTSSIFDEGPSKVMRNDGTTFTDVSAGSGFDVYPGASTEYVTHDFDNDGYLDILGGNSFFLGHGDFTFTELDIAPSNGPVGDLNNDGFLDILSGNVLYMNTGNDNHWITINTIGTVSNRNGIGARVVITSALGTQIRDVRSGDGFGNMSTLMTHFGLGADTGMETVTVYWPSGIVDVIDNPALDATLNITEGDFSTGVLSVTKGEFSVFPNPAEDVLYVRSDMNVAQGSASVFDAAGKCVLTARLQRDKLDISDLKIGVYMLRVVADGELRQQQFVKR